MTTMGATRLDSDVAGYVRSICGEGMRTESWELIAREGQPHKLQVRIVVEPGCQHIGEEYAAQSHIDRYRNGRNRWAHNKPLERLAAAQQFAVDLAGLL